MTETLTCPKCAATLNDVLAAPGAPQRCRGCNRLVEGLIFPAYRRPVVTGKAAEALVAAEDAGCFYHPQSRAQAPCEVCGRFLCALCDVELHGRHVCPSCVGTKNPKRKIAELDGSRILYGGIAIILAIVPLLFFWPVSIVTGPIAIFFALYGWRKPRSIVRPGSARFVVAILLGLIQLAVWILAITGIFKSL